MSTSYFSDEKNLQYVVKITYLFALIGTFANIIFNLINQNAASAAEVGLGIAGVGIMFAIIFTMMYLNITEGGFSNSNIPSPKVIITFIIKLLPTVSTFVVIALYFALNAMYQKRIDEHNVATEYKSYATFSSFLVFIQTAIVGVGLWNIFSPSPTNETIFKKVNKLLIILILFVINLYLCGISNVILKYFSTDG
jgi:cytochrome bd-type quinol oxidase subunit 2